MPLVMTAPVSAPQSIFEAHRDAGKENRFVQEMESVQVGICTSLKDEGHSLRPWLEFHALVGVSKFFLLNDGSSDTTAAILSEYAAKGLVTELQPWSDSERITDSVIVRILRRCYDVAMPELDWMLVIDGDEYVFPIGPECSLPAYVRNNCPRRQTHVLLRWTIFGSNGHILRPASPPIESFLWSGGDCTSATLGGKGKACGQEYTAGYCNECRHTKLLLNARCLSNPLHGSHNSAEHWPGRLDLSSASCIPGYSPRPHKLNLKHELNGSTEAAVSESLRAYWSRHEGKVLDTPEHCRAAAAVAAAPAWLAKGTSQRRSTGPPPFHQGSASCCSGGLALYHFAVNSREANLLRRKRGSRSGVDFSFSSKRELNAQFSPHALRYARALQQRLYYTANSAVGPFDVSFHHVANGRAGRTSHEPGRVACSVHRQLAFRGGVRLSFFRYTEWNGTHGGPGACCELCVHRPECETWTWRLGANDDEGASCALLRDGRGDDKLRLWTREKDAVSGIVIVDECTPHPTPRLAHR